MRPNPVKQALKAGRPSLAPGCRWAASRRPVSWPAAGFDWLTVDIEHSLVDWETATHMFASIADAGCMALARVPANRHDHIKRVLDNGAQGVVVPMVNSRGGGRGTPWPPCLYPPAGNRSVGGSVHALNFDTNGRRLLRPRQRRDS